MKHLAIACKKVVFILAVKTNMHISLIVGLKAPNLTQRDFITDIFL